MGIGFLERRDFYGQSVLDGIYIPISLSHIRGWKPLMLRGMPSRPGGWLADDYFQAVVLMAVFFCAKQGYNPCH